MIQEPQNPEGSVRAAPSLLRRAIGMLASRSWVAGAPGDAGPRALTIGALIVALLIAAPILGVAAAVLYPTGEAWEALAATVLPRYILNTVALGGLVAFGVAAIGVPAAWLVTMFSFPGRRLFELALALPLAFPAYVIGYAYTDLMAHHGPIQSGLRAAFDLGPRDYWFPNIHSLPGAAAMLVLVLYPYVYLLARAAFLQQSLGVLDVARTLGSKPIAVFLRVALPMARPAVATGMALALMETFADYGTVSYFGVQTFATGVFKAWFSMHDRIAAAQLAGWLLLFVIAAVAFERWQRSAQRFQDNRARFNALPQPELKGWRGWVAAVLCGLPALFGFFVPFVMLTLMSIQGGHDFWSARYLGLAWNSFVLAGLAAAATVALAVLMAYAARLAPGRISAVANTVAATGYAVPGSVIAVGLLIPLAALDNAVDAWLRAWFGVSVGLLLTGSIFVLIYAYVVRFMAVALQTVEAALGKVTPSMDHAARALGENAGGALWRVHLPIIRGGLLTAALIVFVDVMKELPATLIMRPFNFDTLAVQAHNLAADERLLEASTPALAIVLVGLVPVLLLSREIRRSRPGAG